MRRPSVTATPTVTTASAIPSRPKGSSSSMPPERKAAASAPSRPRPARTRPSTSDCPGIGRASLISQRRGAGFTGSAIYTRMFDHSLAGAPPRSAGPGGGCHQLAQHHLEDAAVAVVVDVRLRVEADGRLEAHLLAARAPGHHRKRPSGPGTGDATDGETLPAVESQSLGALPHRE